MQSEGDDYINRRNIIFAVFLIMLASGYYWYSHFDANTNKTSASPGTGVRVGQNLAPFNLDSLTGSEVTVGQSGKIIVINFWATWCPPCQEEMPDLEVFAQRNRQKIDFYAVNLHESEEKIKSFMNANHYTMPVLLDKDGAVAKNFQVTAIPTTIIINKHGMIKYRKSGAMTINELEGIINSL